MKSGLFGFAFALGAAVAVPVAIVASAPAAAQASTLPPATMSAIDAIATETVRSGQTTGMVIGVSIGGSLAFVRGYGAADLEHNVPMPDRGIFRIGSVTKQFTAAAMLMLAEDGKVSIDDTLSKYLPGFPRASEVTLRQLLTHTSGVHSYTAVEDFFPTLGRHDMTTEQMLDYIAKLDPPYDFDPGTSYKYSDSGYFLLGAVIEKVSGQSYGAFMKARIFDPQGLGDTAVDDTAEIVAGRANGYTPVKEAPGKFIHASYISMGAAGAAGAIRSTAGDLLKWANALLGGKVLKPQSLAMMLEPGRLKNGQLASTARSQGRSGQGASDYGFGLMLRKDEQGRRMIGHGGWIHGYNSSAQNYPDQHVSIVLLSNADGPATRDTVQKVTKAFFDTRTK